MDSGLCPGHVSFSVALSRRQGVTAQRELIGLESASSKELVCLPVCFHNLSLFHTQEGPCSVIVQNFFHILNV